MAVCKAISEGYQEFTACAVVADHNDNDFISPCGTCRQFMAEFAYEDFSVYMSKPTIDTTVLISSIYKLLPNGLYGKIHF